MLYGKVDIIADLFIIPDDRYQLLREICRVQVMKPDPLKRLNIYQFTNQLRQFSLPVKIEAIITEILCYEYEFPDPFRGKYVCFFKDRLQRF